MTSIPLRDNETTVCDIRDLGEWAAMDAYRTAFAEASSDELTGAGGAVYYLRQAALESVIAQKMRTRATISIHRALLAGVSVGEIAHVLGNSPVCVADRWRGWADGQRRLNTQCPGLGLRQGEYERAAAVLGAVSAGDDTTEGFTCCACRGGDTQIGSPRP